MELQEFKRLINLSNEPEELNSLLIALWHDARGDWDAAHNIAQEYEGTSDYDRLHAYLHRKEGDAWNADYWYRRAKIATFKGSLDSEWDALASYYLAKY